MLTMSAREVSVCWYWPLLLLWVVQKPIAAKILKTCFGVCVLIVSVNYVLMHYQAGRRQQSFLLEDCNILMLHMDPYSPLSLVQECGIDSVALHHEDLTVCLGVAQGSNIELMEHRLRNRDNLEIVEIDPDNLVRQSPGEEIWTKYRKELQASAWSSLHISRLVSLSFLWRYGGLYIEKDILLFHNVYNINSSFIPMESEHPTMGISSGVVKVVRHHPFILHWFSFINSYDPTMRGEWGQHITTEALLDYCEQELLAGGGREPGRHDDITVLSGVRCQNRIRILPRKTFFPLEIRDWKFIFSGNQKDIKLTTNFFDADDVSGLKLWNGLSSAIQPEDIKGESGFVLLSKENCPNIYFRNMKDQLSVKSNKFGKKAMELVLKMRIQSPVDSNHQK